jgi:hypothetical protein
MPRPACDPTTDAVCGPNRRARAEGTFRWDRRRRGWFWLDCRTPEHEWKVCPWCGSPLPAGGELTDRMDAIRQSDGNPHETGEGSE